MMEACDTSVAVIANTGAVEVGMVFGTKNIKIPSGFHGVINFRFRLQ